MWWNSLQIVKTNILFCDLASAWYNIKIWNIFVILWCFSNHLFLFYLFIFLFFYFLIFQNQSAARNVIQLTKEKKSQKSLGDLSYNYRPRMLEGNTLLVSMCLSLYLEVIPESNCRCLGFYHEVGSGLSTENILVTEKIPPIIIGMLFNKCSTLFFSSNTHLWSSWHNTSR